MTPVNQTIVDKGRGDCLRAAIASLLNLELEQVPHLRLFPDSIRFRVYCHFLQGCGYSFEGTGYLSSHKSPSEYPNVDGYVIATVPSKEFVDTIDEKGRQITHAVIMDVSGLVVHDPQPNKKYQGINVIDTSELLSWAMIEKHTPGF